MHGLSTSISKQTNMKKTIIITLVAAALLGTQSFATEGTVLEGGHLFNEAQYYGDGVDGSNVTISAGGTMDCSGITVYSSYQGSCSNNTITMTGGTVKEIIGADSSRGPLTNNTIILAGGTVLGGAKFVGSYSDAVVANNKIVLVGEGGTYGDIQGNRISVGGGIGVWDSHKTISNTFDIYGAGISVGGIFGMGFKSMAFHLSNNLLDGDVMLTTEILNTPNLSIDAVEALDWKPGQSITLLSNESEIVYFDDILNKEYDIKLQGTELQVATARLVLSEDNTQLKLVYLSGGATTPLVPSNIPEPTTGTLSLLALAALASRRRRK